MATFTFDGDNLLIIAQDATDIDVQVDLYSDWKEWLKLSDNAKYPPAFDTDGGRNTSPTELTGRNFFLRNDLGWRVRPHESDYEPRVIGNLFKADVTLDAVVPTLGGFTVLFQVERSNLSSILGSETDNVIALANYELVDQRQYNSDDILTNARRRLFLTAGDLDSANPSAASDPLVDVEGAIAIYTFTSDGANGRTPDWFRWKRVA